MPDSIPQQVVGDLGEEGQAKLATLLNEHSKSATSDALASLSLEEKFGEVTPQPIRQRVSIAEPSSAISQSSPDLNDRAKQSHLGQEKLA